jgi:hypothetical protein
MSSKPMKGTLASAILLIFLLFVLYDSMEEQGYTNILSYMNDYPLMIIFFILPIISFCYSAIKTHSLKKVKDWILTKSLKYILIFTSLIITTYVVYYILILGNPKTPFEYLSALVILIATFIVFLFLRYCEELAKVPIDKVRAIKKSKQIFSFFAIILGFSLLIGLFYYGITNYNFGFSWLLGYMQSMFIYAGIMSDIQEDRRKKIRVIISIISNIVIVYIFSIMEFQISEYVVFYVLFGTIFIVLGTIYGKYSKDNRLKRLLIDLGD